MLLGGSFTGRLNQNLREQRGWAYGAYSRFQRLLDGGHFVAQAAVRTDVTADAVQETLKEIRRLRVEPVARAELEKGQKSLIQGMILLTERVAGLAQVFADIVRYGLPMDDLAQRARKARAVTPAQVQEVARRALLPQQATIVVVGDRKKIEPALRRLELGGIKIEYRDADGKALAAP